MPRNKKVISWLVSQFPNGVTYKIPAKAISKDDSILRDKEKLIEEASKKPWSEIMRSAQIVSQSYMEAGDIWKSAPKEVLYE